MRFVPGWDTKLKQMLQQGEHMSALGKAVVSSYPPAYEARYLYVWQYAHPGNPGAMISAAIHLQSPTLFAMSWAMSVLRVWCFGKEQVRQLLA